MDVVKIGFGVGYKRTGEHLLEHERCGALRRVKRIVFQRYGGGFFQRGEGGWVDEKGHLICEEAYLMTVYANATQEEALMLGQFVGEQFEQSAVTVEFNGVAHISKIRYGD